MLKINKSVGSFQYLKNQLFLYFLHSLMMTSLAIVVQINLAVYFFYLASASYNRLRFCSFL